VLEIDHVENGRLLHRFPHSKVRPAGSPITFR
jgi:hypothetical protein